MTLRYKNLIEMFFDVAEKYSDKTALLYKENGKYIGIDYNEFRERVVYFASGLISMGISQNDKISILSENKPEWAICDLGIIYSGGITVPIYPTLPEKQIEYMLNDASVKLIIISRPKHLEKINNIYKNVNSLSFVITLFKCIEKYEFKIMRFDEVINSGKENFRYNKSKIDELWTRTDSDDVSTIIYTSGTTGYPKGVMLTHRNVLSNIESCLQALYMSYNDVFLSFLPLSHILERTAGQFLVFYIGATIAYAESIATIRENTIEVKPTVIITVPRIFEKMYYTIKLTIEKKPKTIKKILLLCLNWGLEYRKEREIGKISLSTKIKRLIGEILVCKKLRRVVGGRLRFYICGGAHLDIKIGEFFDSVGIKIIEGYGLTETSPVIAVNRLKDYKIGTVGKVIPGVEVKIAEDGEILTRGNNVMKGYYNDEEGTKIVIDEEGWFHTGDLGFLDRDGYLYITDRKKNIIVISSGKNIAPQLIEELILTSKYIEQIIIVGHKRKYLSALIVPNFENIKDYGKTRKIIYKNIDDLIQHNEIYNLIKREIEIISKNLNDFEKIKKITLLNKEFSIESEELTPSYKIRRNIIEKKYMDIINKMYDS
jgi:long-chain acyl-CoA synthetase